MEAAIDIRPTYSAISFSAEVAPVYAQVWGQHPVRLRWRHTTRIEVPAGQTAVGVWMKWVTKAHMGLCHAVVQLGPGELVGLEWKAPGSIFGTGKMVAADVGPPAGLAVPDPTSAPADLGPQKVGPPHPTQPLGAAPAAAAPVPSGQWAPDPTGRFPHRWWDGSRWTDAVSDGTTTSSDPI